MPQGIFHCSVKVVSRSAGRSVVAAAAYRLGEKLLDEREMVVHDYTRKRGVEASFTVAPIDAPEWVRDPERLWNEAEKVETRARSTVGREVELALPSCLSFEERKAVVDEFAGELVERYKVAVSVAMHEPGKGGDDRNYHAHILFTTREMTPEGLGKKTRILDAKATGSKEVKKLRELGADIINAALRNANSDIRVDHRSFAEQGIEREATIHLGPKASGQERRGEPTRVGDYNRHVRDYNAMLEKRSALEQEIAQAQQQAAEPPRDSQDAAERVFEDVRPFAKAVRSRRAVADVQSRDRIPWWQRVGLSLMAEKAKMLARSLSQKAQKLWQTQSRDARMEKMPDRGRDR